MPNPKPPDAEANQHWSLDRRLQPAFLIGLVIQTVVMGVYIGRMDNRVQVVEERLLETRTKSDRVDGDSRSISDRMVRLEERVAATLNTVLRLERLIDRRADMGGRSPAGDTP